MTVSGTCPDCGEPAHVFFCSKPAHIPKKVWAKMEDHERVEAEKNEIYQVYQRLQQMGVQITEEEVGMRGELGPVVWVRFSKRAGHEFDWRIGFRPVNDGIQIYDGSVNCSLGYIDLFYRHEPDCSVVVCGPHSQYVIDTSQTSDDIVGVVKYLNEGTVVSFEVHTEDVGKDKYGDPLYGISSPGLTAALKRTQKEAKKHEQTRRRLAKKK